MDWYLVHTRRGCEQAAAYRLEHSLQTATRAERDGRDDEYVLCSLIHDIGDTLAPYDHPAIAATILRGRVAEENLFMVEQHGIEALGEEFACERPAAHGVVGDDVGVGPAARHVVADERPVARIVVDH